MNVPVPAAFALGLALVSPGAAQAALLIDQNQPVTNSLMAHFGQVDLAQSFKPAQANSAGAGFLLARHFGTGSTAITISLWDKLPSLPGAVELATGTAITAIAESWVDVQWAPVAVVPGNTYYLEFSSSVTTYGIRGSLSDSYAGGQAYANGGFTAYPAYDYTFRTAYDDSFAATPEPATLAVLGAGLLGLGLARRRVPAAAVSRR